MKKVTLPSNFGNYDFKELAKKEKKASLKVRYLALSHIASGKTVLETATIVLKSSRMIHRWLKSFAKFGIEGLKDKSGRGRILCLPKEKEPEFKNIVSIFLKENKQTKITGNDIKKLLKNHYTIDCTLPTAYSILTRLKLNSTKPKSNPKVYLLQQSTKVVNSLAKNLKVRKV